MNLVVIKNRSRLLHVIYVETEVIANASMVLVLYLHPCVCVVPATESQEIRSRCTSSRYMGGYGRVREGQRLDHKGLLTWKFFFMKMVVSITTFGSHYCILECDSFLSIFTAHKRSQSMGGESVVTSNSHAECYLDGKCSIFIYL